MIVGLIIYLTLIECLERKKDARLKSFVKTIGRRKLLYNIWCICRELEEVFERMPLFLLFNANVSFEYDKIVLVFCMAMV